MPEPKEKMTSNNITRKRVTMSDIAKKARCSQSTVSFVLNANNSVQISEATRERVISAATALGYQPTQLPGLASPKTVVNNQTIAFVIDSLSTSAEGVVAIAGIQQALKQTGEALLITETRNDPELEPRILNQFINQNVAAIIYSCIFTRKIVLPEVLKNTDIPVFLLNCYTDDLLKPSVIPSEIAAGQRATQALIDVGHQRIATIIGEEFMDATQDRLTGYRRALSSADIPFDPALVMVGDWSASAGYRGTKALMSLDNPPTAIFCQNDAMAIGCYERLKEMGLSIPEDVSVIGFDDEEIARHLSPPLTSLILPHRAMGRWAVEQLHYNDNNQSSKKILPVKLECKLVERKSVAAPKK